MEENKQQPEEQGKEAKKVAARYDKVLGQITALMGPDWFKSQKIGRGQLPELIEEIVQERKKELYDQFKVNYKALVEERRRTDRTIAEKQREFEKIVTEAKKEFLKKSDAALGLIAQIEQVEREYYQTLGENTDQPPTIEETPNQ